MLRLFLLCRFKPNEARYLSYIRPDKISVKSTMKNYHNYHKLIKLKALMYTKPYRLYFNPKKVFFLIRLPET